MWSSWTVHLSNCAQSHCKILYKHTPVTSLDQYYYYVCCLAIAGKQLSFDFLNIWHLFQYLENVFDNVDHRKKQFPYVCVWERLTGLYAYESRGFQNSVDFNVYFFNHKLLKHC